MSGRGELQLSVLIENMRREGFEIAVGTPNVILRFEGGVKMEPIEEVRGGARVPSAEPAEVIADVNADQIGMVIERVTGRKGELKEMKQFGTRARLTFLVPARRSARRLASADATQVRGLLGFRSEFTTETRGTGVLNSSFHSYAPFKGSVQTGAPARRRCAS